MYYPQYNDYELIYYIQTFNDEWSLKLMISKYKRLIWKNIHLLCYETRDRDDFYQEGVIQLTRAVYLFDESKGKTFTRYFELILKRKFYDLNKKQNKFLLSEDEALFNSVEYEDRMNEIHLLEKLVDKFEYPLDYIYEQYFLNSSKIDDIADHLKWNVKKVYNSIYKIRNILKSMI